jgi:hypothetical protein
VLLQPFHFVCNGRFGSVVFVGACLHHHRGSNINMILVKIQKHRVCGLAVMCAVVRVIIFLRRLFSIISFRRLFSIIWFSFFFPVIRGGVSIGDLGSFPILKTVECKLGKLRP